MVECHPRLSFVWYGAVMDALGYRFKNQALLDLAYPHRHAQSRKQVKKHDERLEFLGDRVLGLVIAEYLYTVFENEEEGALARRLADLASGTACAKIARNWGIDAQMTQNQYADICEAVIGAVYLDGGLEVVREFILRHWKVCFTAQTDIPIDAKTALQEWSSRQGLGFPKYRQVTMMGKPHNPQFTYEAMLADERCAQGTGYSRKEAEKAAAAALFALVKGDTT